ncbi:PINIT domain-containing protein [Mycena albidolilacea]|uniref:PINIT domain-containing protein n=1 Tax=Mycena albidolilacea TaxID=1033008 RepID=A0AAD7EBB2_9AGAR|nr:PINIT domain-containing protein [Mycena albidolilacea]
MASLHSGSAWTDLDAVSKALPSATAVALKQIIISLNMECGTHMIRSGKKQDLVDRLRAQFATWKSTNNIARWKTAKAIIDEARLPVAAYMPITSMSSLPPRPPASSSAGYSMAPNPAHIPLPPSRSGSTFGSPYPTNYPAAFRFKPSPFFTIDQVISTVLECPESFSATDRRECTLNFQLNDDQLAKLKMPGSGYQLRLFCTSSKFYFSTATTTIDCPIEFPQTCEVYVNDVQVKTALLKGIKKRPGTAPPPELAPVGSRNAVRMIYINGGQGQLEYKKYYLVVQLVKTTSVSALVDHLLKTRFVSGADIRRQMVASMSKDDDIIAGSLKMSLKCPLSFMRIITPCRSAKCTHSQCFDATSWYSMMEQTTTWLCPVCENVLDWRELIIDGFFAEILKTTPDSVDDVLVEADGEWSTSDGMYSSAKVASGVPFLAPYDYIDSDSE